MSVRAKKNLFVWSVIVSVTSAVIFLFLAGKDVTRAQEGGGNTGDADLTPDATRVLSTSTTEDVAKRSAWKREYVVEREIEYVDPETGELVQETVQSRIVEVASGLNYLDNDEWKPSNPHFVATANGFELVECAYKATFGNTLSEGMTYEIDGVSFPMAIEYIITSDGVNQQTLEVAANVAGEIDAGDPSVLHFTDAFNNIDVTYRAYKGGFHQDVKLKNTNALKFDAINQNDAKVYVYTKIDNSNFAVDGVSVEIASQSVNTTDFAFTSTDPVRNEQIILTKSDGENVKPIFGFDQSVVYDPTGDEADVAERQLWRDANSGNLYLVESIGFDSLQDGSVIDYPTWSGPITEDTVWTADTTYFVSGDINLSAELLIEPGTVIKFNSLPLIDVSINVNSGGKIIAEGEPWNYIVFTSKDDNGAGDNYPGSDGTPSVGDYDEAINLNYPASGSVISYCKIAYATKGIRVLSAILSDPIRNNIIADCVIGIQFLSDSTNEVRNNLITGCTSYGISILGWEGTFNLFNNTIDGDGNGDCIYIDGAPEGGGPTVNIKDTIVSRWETNGIVKSSNATVNVDHVTYYRDTNPETWISGASGGDPSNNGGTTNPYDETTSLGKFYLNSTYYQSSDSDGDGTAGGRGFETGEFTYTAPTVCDNIINQNVSWNKAADPGYESETKVTRGYHHNRVDYVLNNQHTTITDSVLIIEPGTVVAVHGVGKRLKVGADGALICIGDPFGDDYNIMASKRAISMYVETPLNNYPSQYQNGIRIQTGSRFNTVIRYTKFLGLYEGLRIKRDLPSPVKNNWFRGNTTGISIDGADTELFNNVFYYNTTGVSITPPSGKENRLYSNTFDNHSARALIINSSTDGTAIIYDNLFTDNGYAIQRNGTSGTVDNDYNGYYGNTNEFSGQVEYGENAVNDLTASPYGAPTSWQEKYKLTQSTTPPTLIDAGSDSAQAKKLTLYTTAIDNTIEVNGLDIGFHYPNIVGPDNPNPNAPTVSITAPANNDTVSGETTISVQASDTQGENPGVTNMAIYIDGNYHGTATPDITSCYWNTSTTLNGQRRIRAFAFDLDGDVGISSLISVDCDNSIMNLSEDKPEFNQNDQEIVIAAILSESMLWTAEIKGMEGETVRTFGPITSENITIIWDGKDEEETTVDDGIYAYTLIASLPGGGTESVSGAAIASTVTPSQTQALLMAPSNFRYDQEFLVKAMAHLTRMGLRCKVYEGTYANWDRFKNIMQSPSCYIFIFTGHGFNREKAGVEKIGIVLDDCDVYDNSSGLSSAEHTFESLGLSSSPKMKLVFLEGCHAGDIGAWDPYADNTIALEFGIHALWSVGGDQSYIAFEGVLYDIARRPKFIDYFLWYLWADHSVYSALWYLHDQYHSEVPVRCYRKQPKGSLLDTYIPPH